MKRRYIALLLAVLLLLGTVVAPVSASAASKSKVRILKVTVDGARIRKGPSSAYDVITSVKKGSRVIYLNTMKESTISNVASASPVKFFPLPVTLAVATPISTLSRYSTS